MTMFWLVYTILAIPQFRHEIRGYQRRPTSTLGTHDLAFDDYQFVSFSVHFSLLVLLSIFHLFADQRPSTTRFAHVTNEKQCPELRAGFVRRICFFWFDSVMWSSYRKALTDKDMFDIRPEDLSANMNPRFEKYWKLEVEKKAMLAEKAKKKTSLKKGDVEQSELSDKCTNVRLENSITNYNLDLNVLYIPGKYYSSTIQNIWRTILLGWSTETRERFVKFRFTTSAISSYYLHPRTKHSNVARFRIHCDLPGYLSYNSIPE